MANKNGDMGDFMKKLWQEMTKPPHWAKDSVKNGNNKSDHNKKDDGKKAEADVSKSPKKRQPPSWWSWSTSDGVPIKRKPKTSAKAKKRTRPSAGTASGAAVKKALDGKQPTKQTNTAKPPHTSTSDLGSQQADSQTKIQAQFRSHGYSTGVLRPFGLTVTKAEPFGPVMRIRTNEGLLALKKTDLTPNHVRFLHSAITHLGQNKFSKCAPFLLTKNDHPYVQVGGETYYATRWIRGQEVDLRSMTQLGQSARTIAEFHEASRGFEPTGYRPPMLFDMTERFTDRRKELLVWKKRAHAKSRPDQVDKMYLKHVDLYLKQADEALLVLRRPEVRAHLLYEEDDPPLIHLDLTPYNMVYTQTNQVVLIDFDFCTYGPRTLDLAHLMRRALQRQEWSEHVANHCLVNYNAVRLLARAEYLMLLGLLLFPHRFWRIAYQHYEVGHDPHHLGYFQLCEAEEEQRQAFLTRFARRVERMR
ncbi:MAG: CotS family spore coat protein [Tumebacillaceae bacterium]